MNYHIRGHNVELTQALKDYAQKKSHKVTEHFTNIISLSLVLSLEKEESVAEATVSVHDFEAHAKANSAINMYAAIDDMTDKLIKQLQKHKEKIHK